jgi:hypothetical protein
MQMNVATENATPLEPLETRLSLAILDLVAALQLTVGFGLERRMVKLMAATTHPASAPQALVNQCDFGVPQARGALPHDRRDREQSRHAMSRTLAIDEGLPQVHEATAFGINRALPAKSRD